MKIIETWSSYEYCSRTLKSRSELRAVVGKFFLHQNSSLFTVTFGEKVLTLAKSRALKCAAILVWGYNECTVLNVST